ncbi:MAG: radical SAM protein [Clostridia bacterium]|nr:radical SAM protein [Clostridia bacterium]
MEACTLCPRRCRVKRTAHKGAGVCGMGENPVIARAAPHFWEEPCISGHYGSGAIFFAGCTLRCAYCQNGIISHQRQGQEISIPQLADIMRALVDEGVHNINFVTPTHFTPAILKALDRYRPPIPLVWNTSGYETLETLQMLDGVIDIYLPDFKHYSTRMGQLCAKAPDYFEVASQAILEMCRQTGAPRYDEGGRMLKGTLVRHLILPGLTSESMKLLTWIADNLPQGTPVSLMRQYTPLNGVNIPGLDRRISEREYRRVRSHMLLLEIPGYEQEALAADAAYVPLFNSPGSIVGLR